ncbi:MAG: UDP-N-acetylmuramate dehydrogenase [Patescibacteria group bacterium]|jgi:UDP-N-acetylmuramate dehydrogenase
MDTLEQELRVVLGDELKTNVLLREHTSIGVGGIADLFYVAKNIEDLVAATNAAYKLKIPFIVLGGGYNVVFSDYGFSGLIIKNESSNVVVNKETGEIIADSGLVLGKILNLAASYDLGGLEFLAGVPGTLGGAVYNNAGSKSLGIGDYVKSVTVLEERMGKLAVVRHSHEWMDFKYRGSKLKNGNKNKEFKPVILTVKIQLAQKRKDEILRTIIENLEQKKLTQPLSDKSAGSFFKNPGRVREQSAGYLLENSGAKKLRVGGASVSSKHANFVINRKNASAKDVRILADEMREAVKRNFHITLEEEVEYLGKW